MFPSKSTLMIFPIALLLVSACVPLNPLPQEVNVENMTFKSEILGNERPVDIYLPPGYSDNLSKRYPVLYINDGQDLEYMDIKGIMEEKINSGEIEPFIAVGIHATGDRLREYGTASAPDYQYRGFRAPEYTSAVLEELMPTINGNYRTLTDPENTTFAGWSLGGLSAFDIAWNHPDLFGNAGVFSGSLWWHTDNEDLQARLDSRIAHNLVRNGTKNEGMRFWFEAGTADETEDRDGNGVIDAVQDTTELIDVLKEKGYTDSDIRYLQIEGGRHSASTWAEALPDFLTWVYGAK